MAEYIEREVAIKDICNRLSNEHGVYSVVENLINHVPAADVQPVMRAHWVWDGYVYDAPWQCSNCGAFHDVDSNYCPNCGADMEVDE